MIEIVPALTEAHIQHALVLSQEYVHWMVATLEVRYPEMDISQFTVEHNYDDVRKKFPGEHVPPYGRLYIGMDGESAAGCIALGRLSERVCEMRTLYVRPAFRGSGLGRQLVETVLADARAIGYRHMRLDTLPFMESAQRLYRAFGFQDRPPYGSVSESLKPYIRYYELDLRQT